MNKNQNLKVAAFFFSVPFTLLSGQGRAEEPTWADVFSPNRIAEVFFQYGVQWARGYVDITYRDLNVDLLRSNATMTQITIWPMPDWEGAEDCKISIRQIGFSGNMLAEIEDYKAEVVIKGLEAPLVCLPSEMRLPVIAAGQDSINIDQVRYRLDYNMPSGSFEHLVTAKVPGIAAIELQTDVLYAGIWMRDGNEGTPVLYLNDAHARIENLGGWETFKLMLPPSLIDVDSGGEVFKEWLLGFLEDVHGVSPPLTDAQDLFISGAKAAWTDFLSEPNQLTLGLLKNVDEALYLDFDAFEKGDLDIFGELQPELVTGWRSFETVVTGQMIAASKNGELSSKERLRVATALIKGEGVPRNASLAIKILSDLATEGHIGAQEALAEVLSRSDAEAAYEIAMKAASSGSEYAVSMLDRLEKSMSWSSIVRLQPGVSISEVGIEGEKDLAKIRHNALSSLHGVGVPRSYARAMYWALLGKALGDRESDWIVEEIEQTVVSFEGSNLRGFLSQIEDAALQSWLLEYGSEL